MTIPFTLNYTLPEGGWQKLRAALSAAGVQVADEPTGSLSTRGVRGDFMQDGSTLAITVTGKPFFLSADKVAEILNKQINDALK